MTRSQRTWASGLYAGEVSHHRTRPRRHRLRYRVFWLLLDLGELDGLDRELRIFSRNRFNLLSFHDRDHGDGSGRPLRGQVEAHLSALGVDIAGGAIRLLTMPRVLGFVFNPISVWFCHRPDGGLAAVIYEVTSTFGVRHAYVMQVAPGDVDAGLIRQGCAKALYVSPFMDMDMTYAFRGAVPGERLNLTVNGSDAEGLLISASMSARRREMTDGALLNAFLTIPLLTFKVVAAIHWEALKLFLKGVRLTKQPAPGASATLCPAGTGQRGSDQARAASHARTASASRALSSG